MQNDDISFEINNLKFNYRVAIIRDEKFKLELIKEYKDE